MRISDWSSDVCSSDLLRPGEEMVWSSSVPELKPELQRLTDEETKDYYGFLSSQMGKPDFGQADLDAYWKGKGRAAMAGDAGFFESIQKGIAPGPLDRTRVRLGKRMY